MVALGVGARNQTSRDRMAGAKAGSAAEALVARADPPSFRVRTQLQPELQAVEAPACVAPETRVTAGASSQLRSRSPAGVTQQHASSELLHARPSHIQAANDCGAAESNASRANNQARGTRLTPGL
jgi:hypothetical protein